jgi:hypothetical protein
VKGNTKPPYISTVKTLALDTVGNWVLTMVYNTQNYWVSDIWKLFIMQSYTRSRDSSGRSSILERGQVIFVI